MTDPFDILRTAFHRRRLLLLMLLAQAGKPVTIVELARQMQVTPPTVWHHAQALKHAGLLLIDGTRGDHSRYAPPATCSLTDNVHVGETALHLNAAGLHVCIDRQLTT